MARFSVQVPDSVADWVKRSAKEEHVSQSAFISNMLSYAMGGISKDIRIMDLEDELKVRKAMQRADVDIRAAHIKVGDVIAYCGATYQVTKVHPTEDELILFDTIKMVGDQVVSEEYHIGRHQDDSVNLLV